MSNITPKKINLTLIAVILSVYSYAGVPSDGPPPPSGPPTPPGSPINEGIIFLFILAVFYALYKLRKVNIETK